MVREEDLIKEELERRKSSEAERIAGKLKAMLASQRELESQQINVGAGQAGQPSNAAAGGGAVGQSSEDQGEAELLSIIQQDLMFSPRDNQGRVS